MIELTAWLVNLLPDVRVAQFAVDGRGVSKLALSKEQLAELDGRVGKKFTITVQESAEFPTEVGS